MMNGITFSLKLSASERHIKALSKNDSGLLSQRIQHPNGDQIAVNRIKAWLSLFIYLQLNRASYPPPI